MPNCTNKLYHKKIFASFTKLSLALSIFLLMGISLIAQHGLKAEYYNGVNFDEYVTTNYVGNINQSWNYEPPVPGLDPHVCSIRWTGKLVPKTSRDYVFSARVDDGIRVWLDDRLIIDQWELNDLGLFQGKIYLEAGETYKIKVEYFNALNEGEIRLLWSIPSAEQSWYEYFFEASTIPIPEEFFFRPDERKPQKQEILEELPTEKPKPKAKPKVTPKPMKKPVIVDEPPQEKQVISRKVSNAKEAEKYIPKNIAFEKGKTIILNSSMDELDLFAKFMLDNPTVKVSIEGHTDPVGDADLNLKLSKDRAIKVANHLVKEGVDGKRIEAEGFGGTRPLVVPKKGEYYPANRRVVFVLSGF